MVINWTNEICQKQVASNLVKIGKLTIVKWFLRDMREGRNYGKKEPKPTLQRFNLKIDVLVRCDTQCEEIPVTNKRKMKERKYWDDGEVESEKNKLVAAGNNESHLSIINVAKEPRFVSSSICVFVCHYARLFSSNAIY